MRRGEATPVRPSARLRGARRARIVATAAALLALSWLAPDRARAENDVDIRYPHLERMLRERAARPAPRARAPDEARPRVETVRRTPTSPSLSAQPERPVVEPSFFVAVLGDSLGVMLADGLRESLAIDRPHVAVQRKARESSGLVREDFYDWQKAARDLVAGGERLDYVLMLFGTNDRQQIRDADGTTLEPLSPRWREIYGQRIESLVATFRARNIPVIWVGLPIMRQERYAADMSKLNELFRAHAEKAGAHFIDVWDRFADEAGQFDASGPDVNGQQTRLRAADGIHLTRAGAVKLAHFVEGDIVRAAGAPPALATPAPERKEAEPAPIDPFQLDATALVEATLRREQEAREAASRFAGLALPDLPGPVFLPTKPAAGPVAPLTAPTAAPGGVLATGRSPGGGDAASLLARALVEGRPQDAKPGRADDFAWPRR
ncbi:MAG: DUF459 domain-containing protein [Rhizobiales bacterium]|nr:DUF459 domain-containing protein [Hyphomicrobiales bacterium]